MAYLYTPKLELPLKEWRVNDVGFLQNQSYSAIDWGKHLGEDCLVEASTPVFAIGRGKVVYSALHTSPTAPESEGKIGSNWGNIIIIAHKNPRTKKVFFSLYGHLKKPLVDKGDRVKLGQKIGAIAKGWTSENGWWKKSHLHFAIYIGPWKGIVLPGVYRSGKRTKLKYWVSPTEFIENYKP
ncbi:M23 family metallopeptidase [Patescibacteria group bacterium]|nr:M23 family metallopeptidase [Patescibacteria group bacterium]